MSGDKTDSHTLSTAQWAKIEQVFDEAMELAPEDRTAYVSDACGDDHGLRDQVEALLLAAESDDDLVADLVQSAASDLEREQWPLHRADAMEKSIGAFRLVEIIGEGGMGVVYLARRDDHEYLQNVAIKVLHRQITSEETQRRFLAERQILADLNHPNIARLLDGGQTHDGMPYIVMEYIDGKPLIEYCNEQRLSIDDRLELFQQVCHAVTEAHRSLIVHRDIKSNNILVGADGIPKLLDFGIAKVLGNHLGEVDLAKTQMHDRLLTPDSASPEQISGHAITTATDIYSLGILLYELLAGCRPFRLSNHTAGEMEQTICHEIPLPPSEAYDSLLEANGGDRDAEARYRSTTPGRLTSRLRGELDSVVLMALKKEPRRRYASSNAFADDIARFLSGEPIRAVRDSRGYRAMKFMTRNRIPVAAVSLFVLAISAFAITSALQSREISEQAAALVTQAQELATQNENMEDTLQFLGNVFIAASPEGLQVKEPTALHILSFAEEKAAEELAGRPEIMGRLLQTIAGAYEGQGKSDKALHNYETALSLIATSYGETHPAMASVLHDMGRYHWTRDWDTATDYYEQALNILELPATINYFANNPDRRRYALQRLLRDMAELAVAQGRWDEAESHALQALELAQDLDRTIQSSTELSRNLAMLGAINLRRGELQTSESYFAQAMSEFRRTHDDNHTYIAQLSNDLALTKHAQGDAEAAEKLYVDGVRILESIFDANDSRLLSAKADLGFFLASQGKLVEGRNLLLEAINGRRQDNQAPTYTLAFNLVQLATIETRRQNYSSARARLEEALSIYADTIEADHAFVGEAHRQYGNLLIQTGDYAEALTRFDTSLAISLQRVGDNHWLTAATQSEKAEALIQLNRHGQARALLNTALPMLENLLGPKHRLTAQAQHRLLQVSGDAP